MITTVIQTSWRRLLNNRSELFLTFVVPIVFFSIFAIIFGSRDAASKTPKIKVFVASDCSEPWVKRAIELLHEQKSLRITEPDTNTESSIQNNREKAPSNSAKANNIASDLVRRGMVTAAILFSSKSENETPNIQVLSDSFDQVAGQVLIALVQKSVMSAQSELLSQNKQPPYRGVELRLTDTPQTSSNITQAHFEHGIARLPPAESISLPIIEQIDLLGGEKTNPVVAMYAAGIAVMFLLFSATTASGSLLEERENSTLDRLLCSRLTMDQLLLGKWAYLTIIGSVQMVLMFAWGALVFHIDVLRHLDGFIAMTIVTSGASASFALLLASLCKTRVQLGWVSTIVILSMSALGGSMVPRYLMSDSIQRVGLCTFNAWALEGFNKVFWRELPLEQIGLELSVLASCAALFIVLARFFAIRWERS